MWHEGGCICGAIHYVVEGAPFRTSVCHCRFCQQRTGSAFAILPVFRTVQVSFTHGMSTICRHISDESGRWLDAEFCAHCGTRLISADAPEGIGEATATISIGTPEKVDTSDRHLSPVDAAAVGDLPDEFAVERAQQHMGEELGVGVRTDLVDEAGDVFVTDLQAKEITQLRTNTGATLVPDTTSRINWIP